MLTKITLSCNTIGVCQTNDIKDSTIVAQVVTFEFELA